MPHGGASSGCFLNPERGPVYGEDQHVLLVPSHLIGWQVPPDSFCKDMLPQVLELHSSALRVFFPILLSNPALHKASFTLSCHTPPTYLQAELLPQLSQQVNSPSPQFPAPATVFSSFSPPEGQGASLPTQAPHWSLEMGSKPPDLVNSVQSSFAHPHWSLSPPTATLL